MRATRIARLTTYAFLAMVLLATGLSATADDLVRLMTTADYHSAARVVPWVAVGTVLQGVYQLTSVGLAITKKTRYYPLATGLTLAGNLGANLLLIPRFGIMGAAYTHVLTYGILAAAGMTVSQRQYPMRYEWVRALKVAAAGAVSYELAANVPLGGSGSLVSLLGRGGLVAVAFPAALFVLGFFRHTEIARMQDVLRIRRPTAHHDP